MTQITITDDGDLIIGAFTVKADGTVLAANGLVKIDPDGTLSLPRSNVQLNPDGTLTLGEATSIDKNGILTQNGADFISYSGVIIPSPNGTLFRCNVDDNGNWINVAIPPNP